MKPEELEELQKADALLTSKWNEPVVLIQILQNAFSDNKSCGYCYFCFGNLKRNFPGTVIWDWGWKTKNKDQDDTVRNVFTLICPPDAASVYSWRLLIVKWWLWRRVLLCGLKGLKRACGSVESYSLTGAKLLENPGLVEKVLAVFYLLIV